VAETFEERSGRRGLKLNAKVLFIIDGGRALAKRSKAAMGDLWCSVHHLRTAICRRTLRICRKPTVINWPWANDIKKPRSFKRGDVRTITDRRRFFIKLSGRDVHRLKVPALLRKTLLKPNRSRACSQVRLCEKTSNAIATRACIGGCSVLLYGEKFPAP
jgi:hypothetical protein